MRSTFAAASAVISVLFGAAVQAAPLPAPAVDATRASSPGTADGRLRRRLLLGRRGGFPAREGRAERRLRLRGRPPRVRALRDVGTGMTGHAESVEVIFDPSQVTYGELLASSSRSPMTRRSSTARGRTSARSTARRSTSSTTSRRRSRRPTSRSSTARKAFRKPIVTELAPSTAFYPAEAYHQDYLARNPTQPYIVYNDLPKLAALKKEFPSLVRPQPLKGTTKS